MTFRVCAWEQQVMEAARTGCEPEACEPALRAHLESCYACSELMLTATSLRQLGAQTAQAAQLPSPGAIWWRAQLQWRQQVVARVTRPIMLAERAGLITALLCLAGAAVWQRAGLAAWWHRLTGVAGWENLSGEAGAAVSTLPANWTLPLLIAVLSTVAGLAAFAVYLFAGRD